MTKALERRVRKRVHDHTRLVLFCCQDKGNGSDVRRATDSAGRLVAFIEALAQDEFNRGTRMGRSSWELT